LFELVDITTFITPVGVSVNNGGVEVGEGVCVAVAIIVGVVRGSPVIMGVFDGKGVFVGEIAKYVGVGEGFSLASRYAVKGGNPKIATMIVAIDVTTATVTVGCIPDLLEIELFVSLFESSFSDMNTSRFLCDV
jgi:hypothetical protein